jgi:hypothetical protein
MGGQRMMERKEQKLNAEKSLNFVLTVSCHWVVSLNRYNQVK